MRLGRSLACVLILTAIVGAQTTYHLGNSLTDTKNDQLDPICKSAGKSGFSYIRSTIPGAPTDWLWTHPGEAMGEPDYRSVFSNRAPIAHFFTQPFAGHCRDVDNESEYSGNFYTLCRQNSPNVQLWLYQQWPSTSLDDCWSKGQVLGMSPAGNFVDAVCNHLAYFEALRTKMAGMFPDRPIRIVPAGLAMAKLKIEVEAGRVPGASNFTSLCFSGDGLHLNDGGAYIVCLVHYACIYGESPEGRVTWKPSSMSADQAEAFKRIAWSVASDYQHTGLDGNGTLARQICEGGGGPADTEPPTVPAGLRAADTGATSVTLAWQKSTDAVSTVVEYLVYRGGTQAGISTDTVLAVTRLTPNTAYTFTVRARDPAGNLSAAGAPLTVTTIDGKGGFVLREVWEQVDGNAVSAIPVASAPAKTDTLYALETAPDRGDNYGERIRGFVTPPVDGWYTFYICGDDDCELWLSSDPNPGNKSRIAQVTGWTDAATWDKYESQQSTQVHLFTGGLFYFEVLHKEGSGGDHVAVAWTGPGIDAPAVIDGAFLSEFTTATVLDGARAATPSLPRAGRPGRTLDIRGRLAGGEVKCGGVWLTEADGRRALRVSARAAAR